MSSLSVWALTGLLLPWGSGALLVWPWARRHASPWLMAAGYGFFVGYFLLVLGLLLLDQLGVTYTRGSVLAVMGGWVILGAVALGVDRRFVSRLAPGVGAVAPHMSRVERALLALFLGLILLRLVGLWIEVSHLPLLPWDAWQTWSQKARVWFETGSRVPTDLTVLNWFGGEGYAVPSGHYPPFIPLLQTSQASLMGQWDAALINLPWWGAFVALLMGFMAQARAAGASWPLAVGGAWLLSSVPMLATHVALAGYADVWVTAVFGLLGIALLLAVTGADRGQWVWVVLLLPIMLSIKLRPTPILVVSLLPILLYGGLSLWQGRRRVLAGGALGLSLVLVGVVLGFYLQGHWLTKAGGLSIPGVGVPFQELLPTLDLLHIMLLVQDGWGVWWWLLLLMLPLAWVGRGGGAPARLAAVVVLVFLLVVLGSYSGSYMFRNIQNMTVTNRGLLYILPMASFMVILVVRSFMTFVSARACAPLCSSVSTPPLHGETAGHANPT